MKKISVLLAICTAINTVTMAQNIGIGTTNPNASAILDITANNRGLLIPRTSTASRTAIANPAKGLLLYDSTTASFWYYNASAWREITAGGNGWNLTGNSGTNPNNNFIGTTDNQQLIFKVNNHPAGALDEAGANAFFGPGAGSLNSTGTGNAGFGSGALANNNSGLRNVGIGDSALYSATNAGANTAVGSHALFSTISSISNTAIGGFSMVNVIDGGFNTAVGLNTLTNNISGDSNVAVGSRALQFTTSSKNTGIGTSALRFNSTGQENTALGFEAMYFNTTEGYNTAVGAYSLHNNGTGFENTALGHSALSKNTDGTFNTGVGAFALANSTIGDDNTAIGFLALTGNASGSSNVAVGNSAMASNSTGNNNIAIGKDALTYNVSGSNNVAIGVGAGTASGLAFTALNNTTSINNNGFANAGSNQVFLGNRNVTYIGGNVNYVAYSDERIKTNIRDDVAGLDFIKRLRPVTYYRSSAQFDKITGRKDSTPDYPEKTDIEKIKFTGFLAQQVEQAANESHYNFSGVHKPKNEHDLYGLAYGDFVVPLVKAVQEQQAIIETQNQTIAGLQEQLATLAKEVQAMKTKQQ